MVAACDYKRVGDGDTGPNTGGMGSFSPPLPEHWNPEMEIQVRSTIMEPVARALVESRCPYRGMLYLGLMLTKEGPRVLEFNCRLGDPEAQVILPLLRSDFADILYSAARRELEGTLIEWDDRACVGVVAASGGYPGAYDTGYPVKGIRDIGGDALVFQAGTKMDEDVVKTDGGRVLTVAALGDTLQQARKGAYENIRKISFQDGFYRSDIASLSASQ